MRNRKLQWMPILGIFVMMMAFAGCSKKAPAPAEPSSPAESAAPAAKDQNAAPATDSMGKYTFAVLCKKATDETNAKAAGKLPPEAVKMALDGCMKATEQMQQMFRTKTAMETYVKHIMDACDGKQKQEWLDCYNQESPKAGEAAQKVMGVPAGK